MRRLALGVLAPLLMTACGSCKDQETVAAETRAQTVEDKLEEGHGALVRGEYEKAQRAYRLAAAEQPKDPIPLLFLADAYQQGGNDAAAQLTYRQADDLAKSGDGQVKRRMAELFIRTAQRKRAIRIYQELLSQGALDSAEILELARLQAREKDKGVFRTLELYRAEMPEDREADAVEADAYWNRGNEVCDKNPTTREEVTCELKAAQMMDELIAAVPDLSAARLLRARFFAKNGYPDLAEQDLNVISAAFGQRPEVIEVRAAVYGLQGRKAEAESLLEELVKAQPRSTDSLVKLAEMKLDNGNYEEAEKLAERAILMQPRMARALYIRARVIEHNADVDTALAAYRTVTRVDSNFAPAYSRLWRIHQARGDPTEQLRALEKLVALKQASLDEKAELADIYSRDTRTLKKGWPLIQEVLAAAPDDVRYQELRDRLKAGAPKPKKPVVIEMK